MNRASCSIPTQPILATSRLMAEALAALPVQALPYRSARGTSGVGVGSPCWPSTPGIPSRSAACRASHRAASAATKPSPSASTRTRGTGSADGSAGTSGSFGSSQQAPDLHAVDALASDGHVVLLQVDPDCIEALEQRCDQRAARARERVEYLAAGRGNHPAQPAHQV